MNAGMTKENPNAPLARPNSKRRVYRVFTDGSLASSHIDPGTAQEEGLPVVRLVNFFKLYFVGAPVPCRLQDDLLRDIGVGRITAEFP
jgi:hypothetical protein